MFLLQVLSEQVKEINFTVTNQGILGEPVSLKNRYSCNMRSICFYYDFLFCIPYRPVSAVGGLGAVGALPEREAGEELVLEPQVRLDYPDAGDAGELVGGDALPRLAGVPRGAAAVAAAVAAEAQAAAEPGEAGRQRRLDAVAGTAAGAAIVAGARVGVAHPSAAGRGAGGGVGAAA